MYLQVTHIFIYKCFGNMGAAFTNFIQIRMTVINYCTHQLPLILNLIKLQSFRAIRKIGSTVPLQIEDNLKG